MQYSDSAGAGDLNSVRLRFATTSTQGAGSCTVDFVVGTAVVRLMDDSGVWGPLTPLGSGTLSNSQCAVNLASITASGSGTTLTLVLPMSFSGAFSGSKNIYMMARSSSNDQGPISVVSTGWLQRGVWVTSGVAVTSVTPSSGAGFAQTFTLQYDDAFGAGDLTTARLRFGSSNVGPSTCTLRYTPGNGTVGLLDDAGLIWADAPIGSGSLSNSQCTLNLTGSSAATNGESLTLVFDITFSPSFGGLKQIYMLAKSAGGASTDWQQRGTWKVPQTGPRALSVTPDAGSGRSQAFALRFSHTSGAASLASARVRFGASNVGPGTCTARYDVMAGTISLLNDAGTAWMTGAIGAGTLANSQCTLNLGSSSAAANGDDLVLTLNITFNASFHGFKNIFMLATDAGDVSTGWIQRGTWTIPVALVSVISASPKLGSGTRQTFTLAYWDSLGTNNLTSAQVRFAASNVGPGTCTAQYNPMTGVVQLLNDDGIDWTTGTIGTGTLANSQCTLNLATSAATASVENLIVTLDITFSASFQGYRDIYMLAASVEGASTGWRKLGTFVVTTPTSGPISVKPYRGAATTQAFTLAYGDSLGGFDLSSVRVRFGASNVDPGTCTARVSPTGTIELLNDMGMSWQTGTLGSGVVANSQCRLNLASSALTVDGSTLTLVLNITFDASFTGLKNIYMSSVDSGGFDSGWNLTGKWTPNPEPGSQAPIELGTADYGYATIAMNDNGEVAVTRFFGDITGTSSHALFWTQAAGMVDIGSLGGHETWASRLSPDGTIIGTSTMTIGPAHVFSWTLANGMVDLGSPLGISVQIQDVNAHGQAVGYRYLADGTSHAFSWTAGGGTLDLGTLGGNSSSALRVSQTGQVIGQSTTADGSRHTFSWTQAGGIVDLGTLGGAFSNPVAVSDNGQVVGWSQLADGSIHAFSWTQGDGMVDIGTLGGGNSYPTAVTANGQVVGNIQPFGSSGSHGFSWTQAGGIVDVGSLGGRSYAYGVNANGQVVGHSFVPFDAWFHAYSWTKAGGMVDLGTLGEIGSNSTAASVNDHCQVVGVSNLFSVQGGTLNHEVLWNVSTCPTAQPGAP